MANIDLLRKQILATICYFDIFSKPLSAFEVWWNLLYADFLFGSDVRDARAREVAYDQVCDELRSLVGARVISEQWGFYFLNGRADSIRERRHRFLIGKKKWDRAVFATRLLRFVPFVRMVAVCNTLSMDVARESSDIDLLIVIRQGRLWMTRLLITFLVHLFGIRRHGNKIASRICLSFYVTDDALDLSRVAIQPFDLYMIYYVTHAVVLYESHGTKEKFFRTNAWAMSQVPHATPFEPVLLRQVFDSRVSGMVKRVGEFMFGSGMGNMIEYLFKRVQSFRMGRMGGAASDSTRVSSAVVISDTMLKFHEGDRRNYFFDEFMKRYNVLQVDALQVPHASRVSKD